MASLQQNYWTHIDGCRNPTKTTGRTLMAAATRLKLLDASRKLDSKTAGHTLMAAATPIALAKHWELSNSVGVAHAKIGG